MLNYKAPASLDRMFAAMADPARRAMVDRLARGPASVSELARPLSISLPAVLQHLAVLESCSVVHSEKVGRVRTCQLDPAGLRNAEAWLQHRRTAWERRLDRLGAVLDEQKEPES